jgi:prephenate dehydrogenase
MHVVEARKIFLTKIDNTYNLVCNHRHANSMTTVNYVTHYMYMAIVNWCKTILWKDFTTTVLKQTKFARVTIFSALNRINSSNNHLITKMHLSMVETN